MIDYNSYVQQLLTLKQKEIKLQIELKKVKDDEEILLLKRLKEWEQELKNLRRK